MFTAYRKKIRLTIRSLYRICWQAYGYIGPALAFKGAPPISVLVAAFSEERGPNLQHLVNNILKCKFVGELVLSHHNPEFNAAKWVICSDPRFFVRQTTEKAICAYRWTVAKDCKYTAILVLDDDLLLFPWQIRRLYQHLLADPTVPHGIAGAVNGRYIKDKNAEVDYLYEAYMVTRIHLDNYCAYESFIQDELGMEIWGSDYLLISKCGLRQARPKIHNTGRTLRCTTSDVVGVAIHKDASWRAHITKVEAALQSYPGSP